jgi:putative ABC transport system permease protein
MAAPAWLRALFSKLSALARRRRDDAALDDEIALHLALMEERLRERGLGADEARLEARRAFGGVQQLRESHRGARGFAWLTGAAQDGQYALRALRRQPAFAAVAIFTLALGIGANTAVFSLVQAVLLRPLPYPSPDRVERVGWSWDDRSPATPALAPFKSEYLRAHTDAFERLAMWTSGTHDVGAQGAGGFATVLRVSPDFFDVVGWRPSAGRAFDGDEQRPGGPAAAVITQACWTTRFGGDPGVVGSALVLDDRRYTIVGVMPPAFEFPEMASPVDAILPLALRADPGDLGANYSVVGRVRAGLDRAAAQADLDRVFATLRRERPEQFSGDRERAVLMTFQDVHLSGVARPLWLLLAGVGVVLLIACTNVANLLLARGTTRRQELAIRAALGASRARIVRQGITEGIVLAALGGAAGVALGFAGLRAFLQLAPAGIARIDQVRLDGVVLAFTTAIVLVTGALFGLASTQLGGRRGAAAAVPLASRGTAGTPGGRRLRQWLIGAEAGLAMLLLVAAVMLSSAFYQLTRMDLGFDPNGLVALSFRRLPPEFRNVERARATERALVARLAAVPGVTGAATTTVTPLGERGYNLPMTVDGRPDLTEGAVEWRAVSHEYAGVMGLRLLAGRWFTGDDAAAQRPVTVVNASFAARYWPGANPIGHRILLGVFRGERRVGTNPTPLEIVGVVADMRELGPTRAVRRTAFTPQAGTAGVPVLLVRAPGVSADSLRGAVRQSDAALPEPVVSTFESRLASRLAKDRLASGLAGFFAAVALALTAIGIYGVVSWVVRHATREIGLRMALGATRARVLRQVLWRGLLPVSVGLVAGGGASLAASGYFVGLVVGAARVSPGVMMAAAGVLTFTAIVAACVPARRAIAIDPAVALRTE